MILLARNVRYPWNLLIGRDEFARLSVKEAPRCRWNRSGHARWFSGAWIFPPRRSCTNHLSHSGAQETVQVIVSLLACEVPWASDAPNVCWILFYSQSRLNGLNARSFSCLRGCLLASISSCVCYTGFACRIALEIFAQANHVCKDPGNVIDPSKCIHVFISMYVNSFEHSLCRLLKLAHKYTHNMHHTWLSCITCILFDAMWQDLVKVAWIIGFILQQGCVMIEHLLCVGTWWMLCVCEPACIEVLLWPLSIIKQGFVNMFLCISLCLYIPGCLCVCVQTAWMCVSLCANLLDMYVSV
jgi:hypothetical protein